MGEQTIGRDELRDAHCLERVDVVTGDARTTRFKRAVRLGQARWRERAGHPIGSHPYAGGRPHGARLALEYARRTRVNFLSPAVGDAVSERLAYKEDGQLLQEDRLFADLLSSMPMCFNVFGEMSRSSTRTGKLVQRLVEGAPTSRNATARFEHSPGRRDLAFIGTKTAFDFFAELGPAVLAVETKYHEHVAEVDPLAAEALARCIAVTEASGIFAEGWRDRLIGTPLQQVWLDHLLLLSMLQHPSRRWSAGSFVIAFPRDNWSFVEATRKYRNLLLDSRTFATLTLETLVEFPEVLGDATLKASFMGRYLDEQTMAQASWQP